MVEALADVDLLGVEFNHDVEMQRRSGRSPALIARVLGDRVTSPTRRGRLRGGRAGPVAPRHDPALVLCT